MSTLQTRTRTSVSGSCLTGFACLSKEPYRVSIYETRTLEQPRCYMSEDFEPSTQSCGRLVGSAP